MAGNSYTSLDKHIFLHTGVLVSFPASPVASGKKICPTTPWKSPAKSETGLEWSNQGWSMAILSQLCPYAQLTWRFLSTPLRLTLQQWDFTGTTTTQWQYTCSASRESHLHTPAFPVKGSQMAGKVTVDWENMEKSVPGGTDHTNLDGESSDSVYSSFVCAILSPCLGREERESLQNEMVLARRTNCHLGLISFHRLSPHPFGTAHPYFILWLIFF